MAGETEPARIDTDGDGRISVNELLAMAVSFYTTDDPRPEFGRE